MMQSATARKVTIKVDDTRTVSGLLQAPGRARACFVLAHGAGAGMAHPFMAAVADGLATRGVATLRYQFPYMEQGLKRPDAPKLAQATVRAAVGEASRLVPGLALVAGGKSFGGRMTSQAQASSPLPGVRGLGVPRLPAACRRAPVRRARRAFVRDCRPHAVLAGNPRCAGRRRADTSASPKSSARARPSSCFRTPIIPSMCPRAVDGRMPRSETSCWMRWRTGSKPWRRSNGIKARPERGAIRCRSFASSLWAAAGSSP